MSKLPAFQFYPGDWRKDMGVQSLSYHDRGVWWEMLCLMHESERRGVLILNGQAMSDEALSNLLHLDKQNLTSALTNLLTTGVASREPETGAIYCRRMVRDEKLRKVRAEAGSKGGNPLLLNQKPTTPDKQNPTPSSSSSVSTTEQKQNPSRVKAARAAKITDGVKHSTDPRHVSCKEEVFAYYRAKNGGVDPDWDGREGKALGMLLNANPKLTAAGVRRLLTSRYDSDVNHSDRPAKWLPMLKSYLNGPIDRFGKTITNGGTNGANHISPAKQRVDGTRRKLAEIAVQRGLLDPVDFAQQFGEEVPEPGSGREHRGVLQGLRGTGPEILAPEGREGAGGAADQTGAGVLPPAR